jgi:hypothetical protein
MVVKKPGLAPGFVFYRTIYLQIGRFEVGLPGLEPGTSSLSEKHNTLQEVSRICKIPANTHILELTLFPSFQDIYSGCCTVAAQLLFSFYYSGLQ